MKIKKILGLILINNKIMGIKRITVIKESKTGRNLTFKDNHLNTKMNRAEFVHAGNKGTLTLII
jgi:hypothetical protein